MLSQASRPILAPMLPNRPRYVWPGTTGKKIGQTIYGESCRRTRRPGSRCHRKPCRSLAHHWLDKVYRTLLEFGLRAEADELEPQLRALGARSHENLVNVFA